MANTEMIQPPGNRREKSKTCPRQAWRRHIDKSRLMRSGSLAAGGVRR